MQRCILKSLIYKNYIKLCATSGFFSTKPSIILGIETSCDDTGCAVVNSNGNILGHALHSQQQIHLNNGGIIPPIAQDLHRNNIEQVVQNAILSAKLNFDDIDAIATTVKPGLPLSLIIGMKYGKHLCRKYNKPFIPIHHMEAHALTIRLIDPSVQLPFLVLLISGGHCLLALVKTIDEFLLLGQSLDDAPGEALDKAARRLKLCNLPEFKQLSGGQAIEKAAKQATNPLEFTFPCPLTQYRDCNFSHSGLKNTMLRHIKQQELIHEVEPDGIIPGIYNLCAGFQFAITRHICQRVQRAMDYVMIKGLLPIDRRTLVVSGGVACNNFIARGLEIVSKEMNFRVVRPPPYLCTDNGIMIAWNGVEKWNNGTGIVTDLDEIDVQGKCTLGKDQIDDVTNTQIKCKWIKLNKLLEDKNIT